MPRASKRTIKRDVDLELRENFSALISSLSYKNDIAKFFQDFLTPEENTMLTKRLMLHIMLENGYKTSDIKSFLNISKETVRVHKNIWSRGSSVYKKIIGKLAKKERTRLFLERLEKVFKPLELALKSKTDMKARAKFASGDWD